MAEGSFTACRQKPQRHAGRWLWVVLAALSLNACVGPVVVVDDDTQRAPRTLATWQAQGRAALVHEGQTDSVNLRWQRLSLDSDRIELSGPIGLGAIALQRNGSKVLWSEDDQLQPLDTLPLDTRARRAARELPITQLGDWLLGYTDATAGWRIDVTQWQQREGWRLPRKLTATHPDFEIRLVLTEWQLEPRQ